MDSPPHSAKKPAINYPWLLAAVALLALFASKSFDRKVPGAPELTGPPGAPDLAENFILRARVGAVEIGNSFAVMVGEHPTPVILTAMHRFGPAGGLAQVPSPANIAAAATKLTLASATSGEALEGIKLQPLEIDTVGTLGTTSSAGDLASFSAEGSGLSPASLSTIFPEIGSVVWLAIPDDKGGITRLRSVIFASDEVAGLFYYRLPDISLTLAQANANTGAPILDLGGEVLGIHVGAASDLKSAPPYGLAQGTAKFLPHLLKALQDPPAPGEMAVTKPTEPK